MKSARKTYHHGSLRQSLIDSALGFLVTGKREGLSLRNLAKALEVSPNAPYRHFDDKDALLAAVAATGFSRLAESLGQLQEEGPNRRYRELADAYLKFATSSAALYRLMFEHPLGDEFAACNVIVTECVRVLTGEVTANDAVRHATTATWSLLHGYAMLEIDGKNDLLDLSLTGEDLARMLAKGIK